MESWSFPPAYDSGTMPDTGSRYWFSERETMDPGDREAAIIGRIGEVMRHAYDHAPFYRKKWDDAGIDPVA
ncbi:MAG: phenylacetate--CoA ligase family protein, partial [Proteobacteria bacterium]|nr:phenylacetate--CoA ligase family protein [Pseudomonadota bacterium]